MPTKYYPANVLIAGTTYEAETSASGATTHSIVVAANGASILGYAADTDVGLVMWPTAWSYSINVTATGNNLTTDILLRRFPTWTTGTAPLVVGPPPDPVPLSSGTGTKTGSYTADLVAYNLLTPQSTDRPGWTLQTQNSNTMSSQTLTYSVGNSLTWFEGAWGAFTSPELISVSALHAGAVLVRWGQVTGAASYALEFSLDGSSGWTQIGGTLSSSTYEYVHTGRSANTTYYYRVKAIDSGNTSSAYSSTLSATTLSIELVGSTSWQYVGSNSSVTPSLPSGWATGDLLILTAMWKTTAATLATPSGWSLMGTTTSGTGVVHATFTRTATSSGNGPGAMALVGGTSIDNVLAVQVTAYRSAGTITPRRDVCNDSTVTVGAIIGTVSTTWANNELIHVTSVVSDDVPARELEIFSTLFTPRPLRALSVSTSTLGTDIWTLAASTSTTAAGTSSSISCTVDWTTAGNIQGVGSTALIFLGYTPPAASAPTVTALSTNFSLSGATKSVVLTGTDFTGATEVQLCTPGTISGYSASSFTVDSNTQITVTMPVTGLRQRWWVRVLTPAGNGTEATSQYFWTMDQYEVVPAGGNWTTGATWAGGAAPTSSVDAYMGPGSGNVTVDNTTAVARSLDCDGYTGTLTVTFAPSLGGSTAASGNRILRASSGMTFAGGQAIRLVSTTATAQTITCAGKTLPPLAVGYNSTNGNYSLADTFASGSITHTGGTITSNDVSMTALSYSRTAGTTATLTLGSSTFTLTSTGTAWNVLATLGMTANTATLALSGNNATFSGSTMNYNGASLTFSGTGTAVINASPTISTLTVGSSITQLTLQASMTVTVSNFSMSGTAGNLKSLLTNVPGTRATLTKSGGGVVECDYLIVTDISGSPANTWYAGANSTNGGNNLQVYFTAAPPQPPASITPTVYNDVRIDLSWASASGATGYTLDRSTDGTNWTNVFTNSNVTSTSVSGLTANTLYHFRVFSVKSGVTSSSAASTTATTRTTPTTGKYYPSSVTGTVASGSVANIDEAPESADGSTLTSGTNATLTFSFPTPTNELSKGTGRQKFRIRWRLGS